MQQCHLTDRPPKPEKQGVCITGSLFMMEEKGLDRSVRTRQTKAQKSTKEQKNNDARR